MNPNEILMAALQYAGIRGASEIPRELIIRVMNSEANIVASMFPIIIEEDVTTDSDGNYDLSNLTTPMVVTDVYQSGTPVQKEQV